MAVGATPSLSATLLPTVLGRFHRLHPGVAIRVSEQGSPQLVDELLAGTLDLALAIAPVRCGAWSAWRWPRRSWWWSPPPTTHWSAAAR